MTKVFYTTTEAGEVLGVSSARVRQMVLAGNMIALKVGRDLLITPEAVELAKQRKTKPGPSPQAKQTVANEEPPTVKQRHGPSSRITSKGSAKKLGKKTTE